MANSHSMKAAALSQGELLLYQIHKHLYTTGGDFLSPDLQAELALYVIQLAKRPQKQSSVVPRQRTTVPKPPTPLVEDAYFRKLKEKVLNDTEFLRKLGTYLDPVAISRMSQVCVAFNGVIRANWQYFVSLRYDRIEAWLEARIERCKEYLAQVQTQIPQSQDNWLHLTYEQIVHTLTWRFTKKEVTEIKTLKKLPVEYDEVFKPFIYLLDKEPSRLKGADGSVLNKYSDVVLKLIADKSLKRVLASLQKELLSEKTISLAISAFNSPLLEDSVVRGLSPALGNFVEWGKALVAYNIITHPFRIRKDSALPKAVASFANQAEGLIQEYYRAKRGLLTVGLLPRDQEYELNFKLPQIPEIVESQKIGLQAISEEILSRSVLLGLDLRSLSAFALVSQHCFRSVTAHFRVRFVDLLIKFERFKLENATLLRSSKEFRPGDFASFLNPAVLLLDEVLNTPSYVHLIVSKQLVDQLRTLHSLTPSVSAVLNAVCELMGFEPVRVKNQEGDVDVRYPHQQLFLKYNLLVLVEKIMRRMISSQSLAVVESLLHTSGDVNKGSGDVYRLALWADAVVLLRKLTNPLLFLDYAALTSDENIRFTAKWFLKEMNQMLTVLNSIKRNALENVPLRELVQQAKERLREEDIHYRVSEYEQIMQLNYVSETSAKLHQRFLNSVAGGLTSALLEDSLEALLKDVHLPAVLQNSDQQMAIQMVDSYSPLASPIGKRVSGNNTSRSIVSLLYRSTDAIPSSTIKRDISPGDRTDFPTSALPTSILFYLTLKEVYLNCAFISKPWNRAVKLHSGLRLHFELTSLDAILETEEETMSEVLKNRKVYEQRNEATRPTETDASRLLTSLKQRDIGELKRIKKPLKVYSALVAPFVMLMDGKPVRHKTPEGQIEITYWDTAVQLFMKPDVFKRIETVPLTTLSVKKAELLESLLADAAMPIGTASGLSQNIGNLVSWETGVWQYHLASRRFYLSLAERKYMSEAEIQLCRKLDDFDRGNFLLFDYVNRSCDDEEYRQFTDEVLRSKE